jgi:hypothetical protein
MCRMIKLLLFGNAYILWVFLYFYIPISVIGSRKMIFWKSVCRRFDPAPAQCTEITRENSE